MFVLSYIVLLSITKPWRLISYYNSSLWLLILNAEISLSYSFSLIFIVITSHVNHRSTSKREVELCIRYNFILCIYKAKHKF